MPLINSLLVRSGDGWSERSDAASITANSRFEAYLALGAIQTQDGVDAYADAQLDLYATPREEVNTGIAPIGDSDTPYIGYGVGDTVTVPDSAGTPVVERVRGITVTENEDTGVAVYSPQFKDFILERDEQIQIAIKKMSNGSIAGSSQVAQPIREQFVPRDVTPDGLGAEGPFIVVADDGSGDFTSIKVAIETVPSETVIYVKPSTSDYSDAGLGRVSLTSGKKITVFALFAQAFGQSSASAQQTDWTFDGFTGTGGATYVRFTGLSMKAASGNTALWQGGASYQAWFDNCSVNADFNTLSGFAGSFFGQDSTFNRFVGNSVNAAPGGVYLDNCSTTCAGTSSTVTCAAFRVNGGQFGGGGVSLVSSAGIGNNNTLVEMVGVLFAIASTTLSMSGFGWAAVKACSNGFQQGTGNVQLTTLTVNSLDVGGILTLVGNHFPNTRIIARTSSINDSTGCVIEGVYGDITTNIRRASITGEIWEVTSTVGLLFESGADECLAVVTLKELGTGGGFTTGVQFNSGADNNVVIAQGLTDATTPISDSGTGNLVNSIPGTPSGAAGGDLSGTYPNPDVVDDSHLHSSTTIPADVVYDADIADVVRDDGSTPFLATQDFQNGFDVSEGANERMGLATLVAGTVTVSNTQVAANSRILLTPQSLGTILVPAALGITARTVGTDFTITSSDVTDTSTVAWLIINPA